jgi:hypothetical protein
MTALLRSHPSLKLSALALLALALFGLCMYRSYTLDQYRKMYDNPIYRWRESVAVALSKMHDPPLSGYVSYGSIHNYLIKHGLALMAGEADPMPTSAEREALIYDPHRLDQLFRAAAAAPIDSLLPPVTIAGNEKGEADFYYIAFSLFGINLAAMWKFYFVLLFATCFLFFLAYRSSTFCLMLLSLFLAAHYAVIGLTSGPWLQTVHNSRFFPALALLPSLHLLLLLLRRERFTWPSAMYAAGQGLLLAFFIFCRLQTIWQPIAIIAAAAGNVPLRSIAAGLRQLVDRRLTIGAVLLPVWPALLAGGSIAGVIVYQDVALDHRAYGLETRTHTFWEPLFSGTVSANPELCKLYCYGAEPYSDTIGYLAVLNDLRRRHDTTPAIAYVWNGQIEIDAMRNMGVYDALVRQIFFEILRHHPWLVLKSFAFDKLWDEIQILANGRVVAHMGVSVPLLLALGVGVVGAVVKVPWVVRERRRLALRGVAVFVLLSLTTTEIIPDVMIPDTLEVFVMLVLLAVASIPSVAAGMVVRRRPDPATAAHQTAGIRIRQPPRN